MIIIIVIFSLKYFLRFFPFIFSDLSRIIVIKAIYYLETVNNTDE